MNGPGNRGTFMLSIDTELDEGSPRYPECRDIVDALLQLMESFEIHATWAVLGYMFFDSRQPDTRLRAQEIVKGWQRDLGKSFTEAMYHDLTQGRDVLGLIRSCRVHQEIGCHTFSHVRAGGPDCTSERFEAELEASQSAASSVGVTLHSLVFPWNSIGHLERLSKYGLTTYRGRSGDWFAGWPAPLQRVAHLVYHWLPLPPPDAVETYHHGVWNLPASYYYVCGAGWGKMIPISLRVNKVKRGLRLAARKGGLFHLWFHPFNFADSPEMWLGGLEKIFAEVCRYRDAGRLDNLTMEELAASLERRKGQEVNLS